MLTPQTLKGFRDFLPNEARKRQYVITTLKRAFESFGFSPLETPALEYEAILAGKYGDEGDKLMYRFEDNGKRRVALRYDQTVPLSRVVAQYQNELTFPFKRYQIQPVWRAENTQKGRYREFLQCDADIVGTQSVLADAELIALSAKAIAALGFGDFKVLVNDRNIFYSLDRNSQTQKYFTMSFDLSSERIPFVIRAIDKLKKIGTAGVIGELIADGFTSVQAEEILENLVNTQKTDYLEALFSAVKKLGLSTESIVFEPTLARGLDYYTGLILEIEIDGYTAGSVCGGGRYDNLIGMFAGRQIPAVGFAFGFDRLMDAMEQLDLFPPDLQTTKVLVTIFGPELRENALTISSRLRANGISTELFLDENAKMEKQLKYANQKQIPFVVIIGPNEAAKDVMQVKNMLTREQREVTIDELVKLLQ